ncbi:Duffy receptor-like [Pomacea canaliculata]|uniref:Duffy receptor-like n=1 Tax=Pomacea canaliculata TaxID=400727 RepID=UPI000D727573|nr:Duffy receptor-like [Pomacea canaliculata]
MVDSGQANKQTEQGSNNSVAASGSNPRVGDTGQSTKVKAGSKEQINIANSGKDFVDSDKVSKANVDNFGSNPSKSDSSVSGKKIGEQHSPRQKFQHTNDDSSNTHTTVPLTVTNPSNSNKSLNMASSQKGQVTSDSNQEKKMNPNLRSTATKDTKETPTKILVPKSNTGSGPTNTADTRDTNIAANPNSSSKPGADGRQKENIPVRTDSTVARTDTTSAADGRFLTTRASSVEKGRVGKDPKANGDNIKTNSSATTVNRKQKRKPPRRHAQSEEEKKAQMEKQYQHMFGAKSDKTRLVVPKMEGIDTVIIKELDKEGRTRTKKKDVKDVVREAKEVANTASGSDPLATTTDIGLGHQQRPASADTLDFDDEDDNDEDDEDLFELVRRKYNLQIDSDEDDVDVKR